MSDEISSCEMKTSDPEDLLSRACREAFLQGDGTPVVSLENNLILDKCTNPHKVNVLTNSGKIEQRKVHRVFVVTPDMLRRQTSRYQKTARLQEDEDVPSPVMRDEDLDDAYEDDLEDPIDCVKEPWSFLRDVKEGEILEFLRQRRHRYTSREKLRVLRMRRAYRHLHARLPASSSRESVSKFQILRGAIQYIEDLRNLLTRNDESYGESPVN